MKLGLDDLQQLARVASDAARAAGRLIAETRPSVIAHKSEGGHSAASQVVTEVDQRSEELIVRALAPTVERFDLGLLTEEREDDRSRLTRDYFWSIDPLDGTLPFIEATPGYAVSIALVARDGVPQLGVVFDPVEHTLYQAVRGLGAVRNQQPVPSGLRAAGPTLSVFADRSFVDTPSYAATVGALQTIAADLGLAGVDLHGRGAAVMNACRVLSHPPACYFKFPKPQRGGGSVWDYAATACMFHEAGAIATDIHGHRLDLNRAESTFMNHRGILFATDAQLAGRIAALLPSSR